VNGRSAVGLRPLAPTEPRSRSRIASGVSAFAGVVAVGLFFTDLDLYAFTTWSTPPPSAWVVAFCGVALVLALVRLDEMRGVLRNPLLAWCLLYVGLSSIWMLWAPGSREVEQVYVDRLRSAGFVVAALVVFSAPSALGTARRAILAAVLLGAALNVYEVLSPNAFSNIQGRSGGLYVNPNRSAIALVLGTVLSIDVVPPRWRTAFFLFVTGAVLLTFSRGGIVCHAAVAVALMARRQVSVARTLVAVCSMVVLVGFGVGLERFGDLVSETEILNENTEARIRLDVDDQSSRERQDVLRKALVMFEDAPLTGNGIGASVLWDASVSSHNVFANMAVDHGVLGLAVALILIVALARGNPDARLFAAVVALFGMFSHNILEERYALLSYAVAALLTRERLRETRRDAATAPETDAGGPLPC
jgi:hypothetical protein